MLRNFATQSALFDFHWPAGITSSALALSQSSIASIERIQFESIASTYVSAGLKLSGIGSNAGQFGLGGISPTAELIGGAGYDNLDLLAEVNGGAIVTAPTFAYTNWQTPQRAYKPGDNVTISLLTGEAGATLNGSLHAGIQILNGGIGTDTINGSDDMDFITPGDGGLNYLNGNGGDDTFAFLNTIVFLVDPQGNVTMEFARLPTASGAINGGSGFDFLAFGGPIIFYGSVKNIEGIYLAPGYATPGASDRVNTRQDATTLIISSMKLEELPANLLFDGTGTMQVSMLYADGGYVGGGRYFDGSGYGFEAGSSIVFDFFGSSFAETIIGTSAIDHFNGQFGDDILKGGLGDDVIDGNAGYDTAVFTGNRSAYVVECTGDQAWTVTGPDGSDAVSRIEAFRFDNGDYVWNDSRNMLRPANEPTGTFRMFAGDGFAGAIGGVGMVNGSNGSQEILLVGHANEITFDTSFSRGGDLLYVPQSKNAFTATRTNSSAVLAESGSRYTIPVGTAGLPIAFADDVLTLAYDQAANTMKLGDQPFTDATPVFGASQQAPVLPIVINPDASARTFLSPGAEVVVGGKQHVSGTEAQERIEWYDGNLTLDVSFNRGGDTLIIKSAAEDLAAYLSGVSNLVLTWEASSAIIPIGTAGLTIEFRDPDGVAADLRVLRYDRPSGYVLLGDQVIDGTSAATAETLAAAPSLMATALLSSDLVSLG